MSAVVGAVMSAVVVAVVPGVVGALDATDDRRAMPCRTMVVHGDRNRHRVSRCDAPLGQTRR